MMASKLKDRTQEKSIRNAYASEGLRQKAMRQQQQNEEAMQMAQYQQELSKAQAQQQEYDSYYNNLQSVYDNFTKERGEYIDELNKDDPYANVDKEGQEYDQALSILAQENQKITEKVGQAPLNITDIYAEEENIKTYAKKRKEQFSGFFQAMDQAPSKAMLVGAESNEAYYNAVNDWIGKYKEPLTMTESTAKYANEWISGDMKLTAQEEQTLSAINQEAADYGTKEWIGTLVDKAPTMYNVSYVKGWGFVNKGYMTGLYKELDPVNMKINLKFANVTGIKEGVKYATQSPIIEEQLIGTIDVTKDVDYSAFYRDVQVDDVKSEEWIKFYDRNREFNVKYDEFLKWDARDVRRFGLHGTKYTKQVVVGKKTVKELMPFEQIKSMLPSYSAPISSRVKEKAISMNLGKWGYKTTDKDRASFSLVQNSREKFNKEIQAGAFAINFYSKVMPTLPKNKSLGVSLSKSASKFFRLK